MKKNLLALVAMLWAVSQFAWSAQPALANTSAIDQQYEGGTGSINILTGTRNAQTFKPTKTILEKVGVEITTPNGTLHCTIREFTGGAWVTLVDGGTQAATAGWMIFDFADLTVVPEQRYGIFLESEYPVSPSLWKYTSTSGYDRGYGIWQNNDKPDWDYNFKTWGYTPDSGVPATDQASTTTGTTATSGNTPSANVSSAIDKPTNLKAEYSTTTGKVGANLTWTASKTTDITGYVIFRSETKGKGHTKVGTVDKKTLTYLDPIVAAGKTYYYIVRTTKGDAQSASSNEASVKVSEDAPPAQPANLVVTGYTATTINVGWDKSADVTLSGYNISILKDGQEVTQATLKPTENAYSFSQLSPETLYTVKLIAKNTKGISSAASEVEQSTGKTAAVPLWRVIVGIVLITGLFAVGIWLIIRNHKKSLKAS